MDIEEIHKIIAEKWTYFQASLGETIRVGSPPVIWHNRISPPFPSHWPLDIKTHLDIYAFPEGQDFGLRDAVRIGRPWLRVEIIPGENEFRFFQESSFIEILETQGVRPISQEEKSIYGMEHKVIEYMLGLQNFKLEEEAPLKDAIAYYAQWCKYNAVFVSAIRERYDPFLTILSP